MKDETRLWLAYANENLEIARLSLERDYLNACLQNSQQAVEKALKAALVERMGEFPRSHNIRELARLSADTEGFGGLSSEECNLLDSIYIPSNTPFLECCQSISPTEKSAPDALQLPKGH